VILSDQFDKRVEFFTFGGSLEATAGPGEMVYSLHSRAPVLELVAQQETISDQLASETEALMGKIEAKWELDDRGFNQRLAEVNPSNFIWLPCNLSSFSTNTPQLWRRLTTNCVMHSFEKKNGWSPRTYGRSTH
jgi:hypothetical protein